MIRRPLFKLLTQKYEVFESNSSNTPVGQAMVSDGLIQSLMIQQDATEAFRGQILNRILRAICEDADRYNSNLSIKVADADSTRLKRFLERFGFRQSFEAIYKRTAGSAIPPSVIY